MTQEVKTHKTHLHLEDGSLWPNPLDWEEVEYRLRYGNEHLTRGDLLYAASVMSAYRALIFHTNEARNYKANNIKKMVKYEQ